MENIFNYHIKNINIFLQKNNYQGYYVYGGISEDMQNRYNQHINRREPKECNKNWRIEEISHIKITNKYTINEFINTISQLEQYLIDSLDRNYGDYCVNDRKMNGNISQKGGSGLNNHNLQIGDKVSLYVFYGYKNNLITFH